MERRLLTALGSLGAEHGFPVPGLQYWQRRESGVWLTGLVALQHVGSSQTRGQTRVPCKVDSSPLDHQVSPKRDSLRDIDH